MIKIPYGISHFADMSSEGYYYVDRTPYIENLENRGEKTILFIRPRRFGKSLFVSMLHHYYGLEHAANFNNNFGQYYIGQHPTKRANQYLVLNLDFSGMDTSNPDLIYRDFIDSVKDGIISFLGTYPQFFNAEDIASIHEIKSPQGMLKKWMTLIKIKAKGKQVYLLVDEYDHFANELLAFNFNHFQKTVGRNGWVRKFYEVLKIANKQGIIDRMFITGIAPITLDNLTTGFNISTNLSLHLHFNEMMGFTNEEVLSILKGIEVPDNELVKTLNDMKFWYDGYLFHEDSSEKIYNPDMVLYFVNHYVEFKEYPKDLLDANIASDYGKMEKMFQINDSRATNLELIRTIVEKGSINAVLTKKYSFERPWTRDDFVSLLYYMGILTIEKSDGLDDLTFQMPNFVIRQLYHQFFHHLLMFEAQLTPTAVDITGKIKLAAQKNDLQPLIDLIQNILAQLGLEDKAHFNEISLKTLFTSFFYQVSYFNIFNELEVRKSPTTKGRVDLLLTRRPPFTPVYQFVFELKYLREKQRSSFETVKENAIMQLENYLKHDDHLKQLDHLKAYVVIFIGTEGHLFPV